MRVRPYDLDHPRCGTWSEALQNNSAEQARLTNRSQPNGFLTTATQPGRTDAVVDMSRLRAYLQPRPAAFASLAVHTQRMHTLDFSQVSSTMPSRDPVTGDPQGGPPPSSGFTNFIPPGKNGWAQNHNVDPAWNPGDGKPQLVFNPEDLTFDNSLAVGGGRAIDAILAGPIANNPPGSPGSPYIPSIFAPQPYP